MAIYNLISFAGTLTLLVLAWAMSTDRRAVNWRVVGWGLVLQWLLAVLVFQVPGATVVFHTLNNVAISLIDAAAAGQAFLFGALSYPPGTTGPAGESLGFFFAFQVLPIIVVFATMMQVLYYLRIMQFVVHVFAWVFNRLMRLSGAESLCAASNIFVGLESVTTIRPYLKAMTRSELCLVLTVGMATVASSVLAAYVYMLHDVFPQIAGHLITASLLSAPAAVMMAKLLLPERDQPETLGQRAAVHYQRDANLIDAVINGAMAGGRMALGVAVLLIAVIGVVAVLDLLLGTAGGAINTLAGWQFEWSLQNVFGYGFMPLVLIMGVPLADAHLVGQLLGQRLIVTEAAVYPQLAAAVADEAFAHPRSVLILAYALCGFAHFASLGIFVGGIAVLVPERRADLSAMAFRALLAATLACLMTGAIAGTFHADGAEMQLLMSTATPPNE